MKRLSSSDSLGGVISMCPTSDEKSLGNKNNLVYSRGFQSMLDGLEEEDCLEESGQISEKKRRLSVDQVKALEKNFEVENKLEPERKVKLAQELGLQPRQVAVWFQNRRARWKTKQLERDYGILKANYDSLKQDFEALQHDKEALLAELKELKSKQGEENTESNLSIKEEEILIPDTEDNDFDESKMLVESENTEEEEPTQNFYKSENGVEAASLYENFRDGSSDSDSSAIFNEDNSLNSSSRVLHQQQQVMVSPSNSSLRFNCSSPSSNNCFQFSDSKSISANTTQKGYQSHHYVKMEEHNFFGSEEPCNFFSEDQAPTLQWYTDQWN